MGIGPLCEVRNSPGPLSARVVGQILNVYTTGILDEEWWEGVQNVRPVYRTRCKTVSVDRSGELTTDSQTYFLVIPS